MHTRFLSLALGACCLACSVEAMPHRQSPEDDADADDFAGNDDDDGEDDDDQSPRSGVDAGKRRDGGAGIDSGAKRRDAGPILCVDGGMSATPNGGGGGAEIGAGCAEDGDCGDGAKCLMEVMLPIGGATLTYPGGYCSKACSSDDACGDGASCPLAALGASAADLSNCMQNCGSADDCRDGYSCGTIPAFGGMAPANPQKTCLPPSPFGAGGAPAP